ncbi:Glycine oxidase [Aquimixticola soesokkakensis]|uniref:Glycine oxidase n=1 Tax=Aquimixticola soesokkakensis TaxID=1519096 RepID=A0A1Y5TKF6_9RHOB|nr:FAD-dependent oxidoreductase [Aquimixticola soesokkakensis]SLN64054.1 Glycine oxidase [Aquimixticola soesokkakensis]
MITIAGAGLAGLTCALELARRGGAVRVFERGSCIGAQSVSRFAGGMLAPWCEAETADAQVTRLGGRAAQWWARITPVSRSGTLVVAPPRDRAELTRFARRTTAHRALDAAGIAALEPALAGRFERGLFFADEAHLDPRRALADLAQAAQACGVEITLGTPAPPRVDLDCTGIAADLAQLRPVRGEMAILHCPDIAIGRTLRLLHPRLPLYLVPRGAGRYMIGATMIESSSTRAPTLRSLCEMLGAAFALHPAFGEASVIETGAGLRAAFPDHLPRLQRIGDRLALNGLYRHGFLLAPAMAERVADHFLPETSNAHHGECKTA